MGYFDGLRDFFKPKYGPEDSEYYEPGQPGYTKISGFSPSPRQPTYGNLAPESQPNARKSTGNKPYIPPSVAALPDHMPEQPPALSDSEITTSVDNTNGVPYMGGSNIGELAAINADKSLNDAQKAEAIAASNNQWQPGAQAPNFTPVPVVKTDNPQEQQPFSWLLNGGDKPAGNEVMLPDNKASGIFRNGNAYTNIGSDGKPTLESQKSHWSAPDWVQRDANGVPLPGQKDAFGNWQSPQTKKFVAERDAARAAGLPFYQGATYGVGGNMMSPATTVAAANAPAPNQGLRDGGPLPSIRTQASQDWANSQLSAGGNMAVMPRTRPAAKQLRDFPAAPENNILTTQPLV